MRRSIGTGPLLALLLVASCGGGPPGDVHEAHGDHDAAASTTAWSDSFEVFVEYAPGAHGHDAVFLVHLTRLADFAPLPRGEVSVTLSGKNGAATSASAAAPLQDGIWEIEAPAAEPGDYALAVRVVRGDEVERFDIPAFSLGGDHAEAEHDRAETAGEDRDDHLHDETEGGGAIHDEAGRDEPARTAGVETISFLKEQQWNADFRVTPARRAEIRATIPAVATVAPRPDGYAEIVSPVDGLLSVSHNRRMVSTGVRVSRGDAVAIVCPPPAGGGSWVDIDLGYRRAGEEYRRAERLRAHEAISPRDFAAIRDEWLVRKASFESIVRDGFVEPAVDTASGESHLLIKTPVGGVVAAVDVRPGQVLSAGQRLMTVVDPSVVRLEADLFERDFYRLGEPRGAAIVVPGLDDAITVEGAAFAIVGRGDLFDAESGTIPVVFETSNPSRLLKIGQVVRLDIFTDEAGRPIAVPASAIVDEDYGTYVFVQTAGESFEKRPVRTGARWRGLVAVTDGLADGERIVVEGAYAVKLAATAGTVGQPHVH